MKHTHKSSTIFLDENFAREIMQLFTIGIHELNIDGTLKLDDSRSPIQTYDNTDIQNFARAWTGFKRQGKRFNVEIQYFDWDNRMDPMKIRGENLIFEMRLKT